MDNSVTIIGAGPAAVSAAWALVERGIRVRMLDAGMHDLYGPPAGALSELRNSDDDQWRWQLGANYESIRQHRSATPKMRIPGLIPIFEGYSEQNHIDSADFMTVGALSAGGLTNAWGCGVAAFQGRELGDLESVSKDMKDSYARVAVRTGLSGRSEDALSKYFGVDDWCLDPIALDPLRDYLWQHRSSMPKRVKMGRSRLAVLNENRDQRKGCDLSGTCMWGCARSSMWSARFELEPLIKTGYVDFRPGHLVTSIAPDECGWRLDYKQENGHCGSLHSRHVLMAAGTIASTRLAFNTLGFIPDYCRLQSSPTAAFMVATPRFFGSSEPKKRSGMAQLSLVLDGVHEDQAAMGNLFSPLGIPLSEFLGYLPFGSRSGLAFLRATMTCYTVGNMFFPGELSDHRLALSKHGYLEITGGFSEKLQDALQDVRNLLAIAARRMGSVLVPKSLTLGPPGGDIHYACTMPCKSNPRIGECAIDGSVAGLPPGLLVIDGAALPTLPAKAHTLTIMANADRIARNLAARVL